MEFQRRIYYKDDKFKIYLEEIDYNIFIHVEIYEFNKEVLKDIKYQWAEVALKMYLLGYEELFTYTKDRRIVDLVGGASQIGNYKGYEVWKWELN